MNNYPKAKVIKKDPNVLEYYISDLVSCDEICVEIKDTQKIQVRDEGQFKDYGFWLDEKYNWKIVRDSDGELILIAIRQ
jgi:hypothetical protein